MEIIIKKILICIGAILIGYIGLIWIDKNYKDKCLKCNYTQCPRYFAFQNNDFATNQDLDKLIRLFFNLEPVLQNNMIYLINDILGIQKQFKDENKNNKFI